jgi:uncharacterized protein YjiS (DUF1127 family)
MSQTVSSYCRIEPSRVPGLKSLLGRLLRLFGRERQARRALREMAMLDDHMLADLGLDRSSIGFAARYGRVPGAERPQAPRRYRDSERALYDRRFFRFL